MAGFLRHALGGLALPVCGGFVSSLGAFSVSPRLDGSWVAAAGVVAFSTAFLTGVLAPRLRPAPAILVPLGQYGYFWHCVAAGHVHDDDGMYLGLGMVYAMAVSGIPFAAAGVICAVLCRPCKYGFSVRLTS